MPKHTLSTRTASQSTPVAPTALPKEYELLTVREVARRLRVDDTTVRRWIKTGTLEAITLPHRGARQAYRVRKATFDALLDRNPVSTSPA